MRIVHVDTGHTLRGGQRQLLSLARGLSQQGHTQLVVCPEASELESVSRRTGLSVFSLPAHDPAHAHGILQLRQQLLASPYQILHAHDGRGQTLAWLASLGKSVRRVASRRVTFVPKNRWTHGWKYGYTCHAVIAVSDFIRKLLIQAGVPDSKIEVVPDRIEVPVNVPTAELRSKVRAKWGFSDQELVLGHLGAFTREKGQDVALDAVLLLVDRLPQARLLLAGQGPMRTFPELAPRLERAGRRAQLCLDIEDLADFYPALDIFVMPSRAEGLGSAALQAMAFGIPVVASRVGGLPEIVREEETGWLVHPDSAAALAEAIMTAAWDRQRLDTIGQNARERAQQFSTDIMLARTEALYARVLSR